MFGIKQIDDDVYNWKFIYSPEFQEFVGAINDNKLYIKKDLQVKKVKVVKKPKTPEQKWHLYGEKDDIVFAITDDEFKKRVFSFEQEGEALRVAHNMLVKYLNKKKI